MALTLLAERSWSTVCPPAVVVNEASDVAFPGGIAPAVKVRAAQAHQSGHDKDHRLPCHVGDTDRVRRGLRYRRGRIDMITVTIHPTRQRVTGFDDVVPTEAAGVFGGQMRLQ